MSRRDDVPRHIPRLRFRPTTQRDLPECFELLPQWLQPDETLRRAHAELWPRLLDNPAVFITTVMEDLALPPGRRIQGWGYGIVLAPAWVQRHALTTKPRAYVLRRIYAELLDGSFELMTDAEVGAVNAAGRLHMINFYAQRQNDLRDGYAQSVLLMANEAFRLATAGYNTEAMYLETSAYDAPASSSPGSLSGPTKTGRPWKGWRPTSAPCCSASRAKKHGRACRARPHVTFSSTSRRCSGSRPLSGGSCGSRCSTTAMRT